MILDITYLDLHRLQVIIDLPVDLRDIYRYALFVAPCSSLGRYILVMSDRWDFFYLGSLPSRACIPISF